MYKNVKTLKIVFHMDALYLVVLLLLNNVKIFFQVTIINIGSYENIQKETSKY